MNVYKFIRRKLKIINKLVLLIMLILPVIQPVSSVMAAEKNERQPQKKQFSLMDTLEKEKAKKIKQRVKSNESAADAAANLSGETSFLKKFDKDENNNYKFYLNILQNSVISVYLASNNEKKEKIYELFANKFFYKDGSEPVEINLTEALKKYGIIEKISDDEGAPGANKSSENPEYKYSKAKAEKYLLRFDITTVLPKETLKIGMQGRASGLLSSPRGICCDSTGNIYVADYGNDRVQKFDRNGNFIYEFGTFAWDETDTSKNTVGTSNAVTFNEPVGVAVTNKNIFVSEKGNNRIQKFDKDGNFVLIFGGEGRATGRLSSPAGIATDSSNYLWVCDSKNDRVQKFDTNGNFMLEIGGFGYGSGKFNEPTDIAIDSKNQIYILDSQNKRIAVFDEYGNNHGEINIKNKEIEGVSALATYLDKMILVGVKIDRAYKIAAFSPAGVFLEYLSGEYEQISSIATNTDGDIFISDAGRSNIIKLASENTASSHYLKITELRK